MLGPIENAPQTGRKTKQQLLRLPNLDLHGCCLVAHPIMCALKQGTPTDPCTDQKQKAPQWIWTGLHPDSGPEARCKACPCPAPGEQAELVILTDSVGLDENVRLAGHQGGNSIDIFFSPESVPGAVPSHVLSFGTCLNF